MKGQPFKKGVRELDRERMHYGYDIKKMGCVLVEGYNASLVKNGLTIECRIRSYHLKQARF